MALRGRNTIVAIVEKTIDSDGIPKLLNIDPNIGSARIRFGSVSDSSGRYHGEHTLLGTTPFLVAISANKTTGARTGLFVWNYETGELLQQLKGPEVYRLSASPSGNRVVAHTVTRVNELQVYRTLRLQ